MHVHLYFANVYARESKGMHIFGQVISALNTLSIHGGLCVLLNARITKIP